MGYLRLVHSAPPAPSSESACVDAFDQELDYIFATLRRLGASSHELEDLAQEVFLVLYRNWSTNRSASLRQLAAGWFKGQPD